MIKNKEFHLEKEKENIINTVDSIFKQEHTRYEKKFIGNKLFIYNIRPFYIMFIMDLGKRIRESIISKTIFNDCRIIEQKDGRIIIGF